MAVLEIQPALSPDLIFDTQILPRSGKNNSPFRYPGGKFYARRQILDLLPAHDGYCEPFAGGASIFFAKHKAKFSILNDLDDDLTNTFICIRDHVELLANLLEGIPACKNLHNHYKSEYQPRTDLERSFRWYYLNRTSYSGIMRPENCYWSFDDKFSMGPENWIPHLRTVSDKLQGVELTAMDFEEVIDRLPNGFFVFADPPYWSVAHKELYSCDFGTEDHERLAACLRRNRERFSFLLTYDDHPAIRRLYDWADHISSHEWIYRMTGKKSNDEFKVSLSKGQELFIRNYGAVPARPPATRRQMALELLARPA